MKLRIAGLIIFISVIVAVYLFVPAREYLSREGFSRIEAWLSAQGIMAPVFFSLIYMAAVVFALPGSVLTIAGGLLFGPLWGTLINLISATLGASIAFMISRYLGRGFAERMISGRLSQIDETIYKNGFYTTVYLRLIPLFPFNVLNYGFGLSKVRFRDFFLGSLIGMAPGSFVYTSMGAAGRHVSFTDLSTWSDYRVWGPFLLVILLTLNPKLAKRRGVGASS